MARNENKRCSYFHLWHKTKISRSFIFVSGGHFHRFVEEALVILNRSQGKREGNCSYLHKALLLFKKLGRTIRQWFEPIIRMWRFTKSNGITEGFHRKMKLIQRRAYGYRNCGMKMSTRKRLTFTRKSALRYTRRDSNS